MTEHGEEAILGLVRGFSGLPCLDQGCLGALTFRDVPGRPRNSFDRAVRRDHRAENVFVMPSYSSWTGVGRFIGQPFSGS